MFREVSVFLILFIIGGQSEDNINLMGDALEVGNPCGNYIITVERLIKGPTNREEYWDGTVHLQNYKNLTEAVVSVYLSAPAAVEVNERDGKLLADNSPYNIAFHKRKDGSFNAKFHVRTLEKGHFPTLTGLFLNGVDICPSLQAVNSISESSDHTTFPCWRYFNISSDSIDSTIPWIATIHKEYVDHSHSKCKGVFISSEYILTTAQCATENLVSSNPQNIRISIPNNNETQLYSVESVNLHGNRIALIKIHSDLSNKNFIKPACLFGKSWEDKDITDFNLLTKNPQTKQLIWSHVSLTSQEQCTGSIDGHDIGMCGEFDDNMSLCSEDSGSPLLSIKEHEYVLRGLLVTSHNKTDARNCSESNRSSFIDLWKFTTWIRENIK